MCLGQKTISFKALQRCRTTIEDFVSTYMPLHGLDPAQGLFKYLDILLFVEATIYQMDEENEVLCEQEAAKGDSSSGTQQHHMFQGESVLLEVLEQQELLSEEVRQGLQMGQQYWQQERRVCRHLANTTPGHSPTLTIGDILATHEMKSFDYRVMHLLLHALLNKPHDETLLEFMRVDEMLVDIGDDLTDYEDDVMVNSFNIYRGYIHLYGRAAPEHLIERISALEAQRAKLLLQLSEDLQDKIVQRQKDAATEEGADKWVFPAPIFDEIKYREEVRALETGN